MKQTVVYILIAALLLCATGCRAALPAFRGSEGDGGAPFLGFIAGMTYSDYPGVSVRVKSLEGQKLTVVWKNATEYDVIYGAAYDIERKDEDTWVSCATAEPAFIEIAYELQPGQIQEKTYDLTKIFDISAPGSYRFKARCSVHDGRQDAEAISLWAEFDRTEAMAVAYNAQYIRTNGYQSGAKFPRVQIIDSLQALQAYYTANRETFDLERKEKVYADTTAGFLDACDRYDEAFFENSFLIFALLEEGSGSVRHRVTGVERNADQKLAISVISELPGGVGTSDMAEWHVILELSREIAVPTPKDVLLYWNGRLAWDGDTVAPPKPEAAFKEPPMGTLRTPEGDVALRAAGYHWTYEKPDGTAVAVIADQAGRPLSADSLKPVVLDGKYAETVYLPIPGTDAYAPTNALGYLVKFDWETKPSGITCTCWPDRVWQDGDVPAQELPADPDAGIFYAKEGGYIYEFAVTWEDAGVGYYGTAYYYAYVIGG